MLMATPSVRSIAKDRGISLNRLIGILKLRRPDNSATEKQFVADLMTTLDGANQDQFGNVWYQIGENPTTLWSCHTDTVSSKDGHQNLTWDGDILRLHDGKPGQSLGADDGAGLWLMLEMIDAQKPGVYVFHRAEEVGGKGSGWVAENLPSLLDGIQRCIAFDRRGTDSVITHQRWSRTASTKFAQAVADALNDADPLFSYKPDDTGIFTDTANYDRLVPECTNISVGYENEHGPKECLDVAHLLRLRDAVLTIDFETIEAHRDPTEEDDLFSGPWAARNYEHVPTALEEVIRNRAYTLSKIWGELGYTVEDINTMCNEYWSSSSKTPVIANDDEEFVTVLFCNECSDEFAPAGDGHGEWKDGEKCPECGSIDTEAYELRADQVKY